MGSAAERAYTQIRSLLIAGAFGPGAKLREEDLAERTGVSRTPVREALRRLASEGFVEFQPRRGVQVVSWTTRDLDEIFGLRALLEGYGAGQAAERAGRDQVGLLSSLCDRMESLAEKALQVAPSPEPDIPEEVQQAYASLSELNNEFHRTVLAAADNTHLSTVIGGLISVPLVQRTFMRYSAERLARSMAHHRELVDAISVGDASWASSVMTAHIRSARLEIDSTAPERITPRQDESQAG